MLRALPADEQRQLLDQWLERFGREPLGDDAWFFEGLDRVNRGMSSTADLERMTSTVLQTTLELFRCDRAWLAFPCNPAAPSWGVVMERTKQDFPGAFTEGLALPVDPQAAAVFRRALAAGGSFSFGPGEDDLVPELSARFQIRSQLVMALFPKDSEPYLFGLHQCSEAAPWSPRERRLFEEIGHRLTDALTGVLMLRSLRQSERRLDDAQRIAHIGYWDRDLVAGRITLSDESCRIFGFAPEERTVDLGRWHQRWLSLVEATDRVRTGEAAAAALAGGPTYDVEYRVVHPNGDQRVIHSRGEVVWGDDGKPTRMFGMMQDITERKRAERALVESHALLNAVVEGTSDPVFVKDLSGRYLMINTAGASSLGRTAPEMVGRRDDELFEPVVAAALTSHDAEVLSTQQPQTFQETRGQAERTRHFLTTKGVYRDGAGQVIGSFGISRDLTEVTRLENQLRQSQKLEAVGRLAGGIAHDFNNLLTVINVCAELALSEAAGSPAAELVSEIHGAGQRAAALTHQLLAFSRQQVLDAQVVDLNQTLSQLGQMLARVLGEDIELRFSPEPTLGRVKVDKSQLEQAVVNLAVNARDALPAGGKLELETRAVTLTSDPARADVRPGEYAELTVRDSGHGMEPATIARIFEPFFTTKPLGKGTGLGLAMVYGFIKQSGGHITVESVVGEGTTFRLLLPLVDEGSTQKAAANLPRTAGGAERLLLAEDEDSVRRVCQRVLSSAGYQVVAARNGEEALELAATGRFDLLLTDLVMPRLGGQQLATKLRERLPGLRVLFLSGYTEEGPATDTPGAAFLRKPFTPAALSLAVRTLLDAK